MKFTGKSSIEISDCIRELVQNGDLSPGDSLPPVRELAVLLEVNRNTVSAAYMRLTKAGVAITQGRLGTTICSPHQAGEQEGVTSGTALINLADGNPNPQWLPNPQALLSACQPKTFLYGEDTILPELRHFADDWFNTDCPTDRVLELTYGAVDAIERLAFAHLAPGDKVAVEDPCFLGTINALRLAGMQTVGIEVDSEGMRQDKLQSALNEGARAVLVTPRAHNPTGCSLTESRAEALQQVLKQHPNVLVIVDDHFALLADTPYFSVIADPTNHWALVRSVSKGLGPDLRFAFIACDPATGNRLQARLAPGITWVSHIIQTIVSASLASQIVRKQLDDARIGYTRRRELLSWALQAQGIKVPPTSGGLNIWVPLPKNAKDIAYALTQKGWLVRLGSAFQVQANTQAIRITVSKLDEEQALCFAKDLKTCIVNCHESIRGLK
jgi:DNA-binding transcriptional MocR family regulator